MIVLYPGEEAMFKTCTEIVEGNVIQLPRSAAKPLSGRKANPS